MQRLKIIYSVSAGFIAAGVIGANVTSADTTRPETSYYKVVDSIAKDPSPYKTTDPTRRPQPRSTPVAIEAAEEAPVAARALLPVLKPVAQKTLDYTEKAAKWVALSFAGGYSAEAGAKEYDRETKYEK